MPEKDWINTGAEARRVELELRYGSEKKARSDVGTSRLRKVGWLTIDGERNSNSPRIRRVLK